MAHRDDVFKKKLLEKWTLKRGTDSKSTTKDLSMIGTTPKEDASDNKLISYEITNTTNSTFDSTPPRFYTVTMPSTPMPFAGPPTNVSEQSRVEKRTRTEPQTLKNRKRKLKKKRRLQEISKNSSSLSFTYKPVKNLSSDAV